MNDWCKSTHGITGPPDQNSRNSGNKCQLARPMTMPNFIALGQMMYEKSVTIFYTFSILAPPCRIARPFYQTDKFRPVLKTPLGNIWCQSSLRSLMAWHTHKENNKRCIISALQCGDKKGKNINIWLFLSTTQRTTRISYILACWCLVGLKRVFIALRAFSNGCWHEALRPPFKNWTYIHNLWTFAYVRVSECRRIEHFLRT